MVHSCAESLSSNADARAGACRVGVRALDSNVGAGSIRAAAASVKRRSRDSVVGQRLVNVDQDPSVLRRVQRGSHSAVRPVSARAGCAGTSDNNVETCKQPLANVSQPIAGVATYIEGRTERRPLDRRSGEQ